MQGHTCTECKGTLINAKDIMRKWYKNIRQSFKVKKADTSHEFETESPTLWHFDTSTKEAWQTILKECDKAQESIYFEQFLFTPDSIGEQFLELLIKKAQEGVHVKLIIDSVT